GGGERGRVCGHEAPPGPWLSTWPSSSAAGASSSTGPPCPPCATCPWRASNTGRSERISGSRSKLYGGGGDEVAHSRVLPPHGSSPAGSPLRSEIATFHRNGSMLAAIVKPPMDASRFRLFQPAVEL